MRWEDRGQGHFRRNLSGEIARTTAGNLVNAFHNLEILAQRNDGRQRYRTFLYEDYLSILRQGSDPL